MPEFVVCRIFKSCNYACFPLFPLPNLYGVRLHFHVYSVTFAGDNDTRGMAGSSERQKRGGTEVSQRGQEPASQHACKFADHACSSRLCPGMRRDGGMEVATNCIHYSCSRAPLPIPLRAGIARARARLVARTASDYCV